MNDRKFNPLVAAAFAAACLAAASAQAEGIYVGGSLGTPHFGDNLNGVTGESSGVSGKVFGGYQLNSNFAIKGGYAKLGTIDNASGTVNAHGLYLDAVGL